MRYECTAAIVRFVRVDAVSAQQRHSDILHTDIVSHLINYT